MIGFRFINLLVPGDPVRFSIDGATGSWEFEQEPNFGALKDAVVNRVQCAETHTGQHPASMGDGAGVCDRAFEELLPLCLGASYLTGRSVTCRRSLPQSHDVVKMRNDLIHDGTLSGTSFNNRNAADCNIVVAAALNWIDSYLHAALALGPVRNVRFDPHSFDNLNAYSL